MNSPGPETICASAAAYRPNAWPVPSLGAAAENCTSAARMASSAPVRRDMATFAITEADAASGTLSAVGGAPYVSA